MSAIEREKEIKSWRRSKKLALIASGNPGWDDLAADWFDETSQSKEESGTPKDVDAALAQMEDEKGGSADSSSLRSSE